MLTIYTDFGGAGVLAFISNQVEILAFGILPSMAFSNCGLKDSHFKGGSLISRRKKKAQFLVGSFPNRGQNY